MSGEKTIEVRTRIPLHLDVGSVIYLGETGSHGNVIGQAICENFIIGTPDYLYRCYGKHTAIDPVTYKAYTSDHEVVIYIFLKYAFRYEKPRCISLFGRRTLPQSFFYC